MSETPRTVAEAFLRALKSRGVDWLFGNAGTDFAPLIEAIAGSEDQLSQMPNIVEILHETVAVSMAHGYYLMTGQPQCAMVHVNVGVANGLMGIINASRGRVPVIFASGRTPITEDGRVGSRNAPIHWGQEMFDQGALVREFVKWDNELRAGEQVVDMVERGLALSQTEPKGPVYLSLPREVLAERLPQQFRWSVENSVAIPSVPFPDPAAIAEAADLLAAAKHPLVITSDGGKAVFEALTSFAEAFAVPVAQFWRVAPAISTKHPMYVGETPRPLLADADVVVVLDAMVPWMPGRMPVNPDAKVIHIGPDPLFSNVPVRGFRSDLTIVGNTAASIDALSAALHTRGVAEATRTEARRAVLEPRLRLRRQQELADGEGTNAEGPLSPEFMSRTLSEVIGEDAIIVNELGLATQMLEMTRHDSFFGLSVSGGLGWAGGAALGVKLAAPERTVVWATGDGSYVFSNPAACHHAAASLELGMLTVVADNRVWNAVRRSTIAVYPQGHAARAQAMPLTKLEPAPDYTKMVEAYGGWGIAVSRAEDLRPALEQALEITRGGRQALVAVHCSYPDALKH